MIFLKKKKNKGFVILFAVTISAMLLAIALGISNIALKQMNFSTSAKNTGDAFFSADTGAECALYNDKSTGTSFLQSAGSGNVSCMGRTISLSGSSPSWSFIISGLGYSGQGCAVVSVVKDFNASPVTTTIISKGYNNGGSVLNNCTQSATSVERELNLSY